MLDLAIRGGTIITAADRFNADIGVKDGRVTMIAADVGEAVEQIDATGLWVMPGGVDGHVHLAQPTGDGTVMADDFESGTRAAAAGGTTTVLPFAQQIKGTSLRACVEDYRKKAEGQCHIDVAFHLIVTDPTPSVLGQELPALVADGYTSFKVFMTYDDLMLDDGQMLEVFDTARREGALVMVHAEGHDAIRFMTKKLEDAGHTEPYWHAHSHSRTRGHTSRDFPCRADGCADCHRACLGAGAAGADQMGAGAWPQGLCRDLPPIHSVGRG